MRNRRGALSGIQNFQSRRSRRTSWLSLPVFLLAGSLGFVWWTGVNRAANDAPPVNLVRLVLTASEGSAHIEVVADGALSETAIERFTRAGETVIRIRGHQGVDRGRVFLADPSRGNLRMSISRFLREWHGIIFVLGKSGEEELTTYPSRSLSSRLYSARVAEGEPHDRLRSLCDRPCCAVALKVSAWNRARQSAPPLACMR